MRTACVILAAGMGKRMRSGLVKVMHPICGQPMIDYPVGLALRRGYDPVVVVVGRQAELVQAHLAKRFAGRLRFAVQDPPQGTGHAVLQAAKSLSGFKGKLVILSGDVPLLTSRDLASMERAGKDFAVAFLTCRLQDPGGYGRVVRDDQGQVVRIVEHRDANRAQRRIDEINTGIYLTDVPYAFQALRRVGKANSQGEYYLTDLIHLARGRGRKVAGVEVAGVDAVLGVNDRADLARTERDMNRFLCDRLLAKGVTLVDPSTTYLSPECKVGKDSVLSPGCHLRGRCVIGRGCRIGPGAVLTDVRVGHGAEIPAYSVLTDRRVVAGGKKRS